MWPSFVLQDILVCREINMTQTLLVSNHFHTITFSTPLSPCRVKILAGPVTIQTGPVNLWQAQALPSVYQRDGHFSVLKRQLHVSEPPAQTHKPHLLAAVASKTPCRTAVSAKPTVHRADPAKRRPRGLLISWHAVQQLSKKTLKCPCPREHLQPNGSAVGRGLFKWRAIRHKFCLMGAHWASDVWLSKWFLTMC